MKKLTLLFCCLMSLLFLNCRVEGDSERVTYQIFNETDEQVSILFYTTDTNTDKIFSYSFEIDGKGVLAESIQTFDPSGGGGGSDIPAIIWEANFAEIIFNNERVEEHNEVSPARSIFSLTYESIDGKQVYIINENNLNNAIPCNGSCN